jgi:hypothetical protein
MENVNDLLKRQLLLMKFDSGVTLKENYEKVSGKNILTEGALADKVKNIVSGCYTRDNNLDRKNVDSNMHRIVADLYNDAIEYEIAYVPSTDCDKIKQANAYIREQFTYADLCQMIFTYDSVHPGDGFYEDIDNDTQMDDEECGWGGIAKAFQAAVDKSDKISKEATAPAPAPAPAPVVTTPEEAPNVDSGDKYMIPGGLAHTLEFFKETFPCVFAQNRVNTRQVYNNGKYDYILLNAPDGVVIQMYFDGYLREQKTLADVTNNGTPAKIVCNGNKITISNR